MAVMERIETARVLVVDDEPQITRVLKTVLSSQGYEVRSASEGESALASFRAGELPLIELLATANR